MPYSVSPRVVDHSVLPKPTKYLLTRTPNSLAGTRWPTSCSAIDTMMRAKKASANSTVRRAVTSPPPAPQPLPCPSRRRPALPAP